MNTEASPWVSHAASLSLHVGVIAVLALLVPPPVAEGETDDDTVAWIQRMLVSTGAGVDDASGEGVSRQDDAAGEQPAEGAVAGAATKSPPSSAGHADPVDPGVSHRVAQRQAAMFGMVGLLAGDVGGSSNAPTSAWRRTEANGTGGGGSLAGAWSDGIGDAFGTSGLGLSGVGEGSGGQGEGLAIGEIGTVGFGTGITGIGEGFGCGCGYGRIGGSHQTRAPTIRCGPPPGAEGVHREDSGCTATVTGRLPPEAVQRIVRQSFGRFRLCYEEGLRGNPSLEGRVSVKFVVDRQGSVALAADTGSDLADESVVSCVVRAFQSLSFPEPEGGIVTVVYPLVLSRDAAP